MTGKSVNMESFVSQNLLFKLKLLIQRGGQLKLLIYEVKGEQYQHTVPHFQKGAQEAGAK
jgi:hypothetical protein